MARERMSERMYKNGPTLESREDGTKYIKKNKPTEAQKKSAQVNDGTDGILSSQIKQHQAERDDMMHKHYKEFVDMHSRHLDEMAKNAGNTGGEMINKVENNQGED